MTISLSFLNTKNIYTQNNNNNNNNNNNDNKLLLQICRNNKKSYLERCKYISSFLKHNLKVKLQNYSENYQ